MSNWVIPLLAAGVLSAVQPVRAAPPAKPAPKAAPALKAAPKVIPRTTITSSGPGTAPLVVRPPATAAPQSGFALRAAGAGKLTLSFESRVPGQRLDPKGLVIQISPPAGVEVTPSVITASDWPKGAPQINLKLSGPKGQESQIAGSATYTLCDARGCRKTKGFFTLKP